jgi:hypothetical protein
MKAVPKQWDKVSWNEPDNYCTHIAKHGFVKKIVIQVIDKENPDSVKMIEIGDLKKGWSKK